MSGSGSEWFDTDIGPDWDDELELTNYLLASILETLGGQAVDSPEGYYGGASEPAAGESDTGQQQAVYSSMEGLVAREDEARQVLGLVADTVVVRDLNDTIQIAFKDPDSNNDAWITVESGDAPFVFSGVFGLDASVMWHRRDPGVGTDQNFNLIALRGQ